MIEHRYSTLRSKLWSLAKFTAMRPRKFCVKFLVPHERYEIPRPLLLRYKNILRG